MKRSRALPESNPPRNSRLETHRSDEPARQFLPSPYPIDRFPHALSGKKPVNFELNGALSDAKILRMDEGKAFMIQFVRRSRGDIPNL